MRGIGAVFTFLNRGLKGEGRCLDLLWTFTPSVGAGLLFCVLLSIMTGNEPLALVTAIGEGAWGSAGSVVATVTKTTPLVLTGLAVSLAYHAGLLNIGAEGQLTLGALSAAVVGAMAGFLPMAVLIPMTMIVGAIAGGLWAFPAVLLRQKRDVHEVVATLLLNYVAIYLADFLVRGPLGDGSSMARTPRIEADAVLPPLIQSGAIGITAAPFLALFLCLIAYVWLSRTVWGFETTAVGCNPIAARSAGVSVEAWQRRMFVISGALAGLAGALEVVAIHHRFYAAFSPGYGFDGITVAFLVNNSPAWLWLSALLLASLRSADKWLQISLGVSPNAVLIIEAALLLAIVCRADWRRFISRFVVRSSGSEA